MTLNGWDIFAAVVIALIGNGFLSSFLLQRDRGQQEEKLERLRNDLNQEVRRLQTRLDRTVFVHRAQFDT